MKSQTHISLSSFVQLFNMVNMFQHQLTLEPKVWMHKCLRRVLATNARRKGRTKNYMPFSPSTISLNVGLGK